MAFTPEPSAAAPLEAPDRETHLRRFFEPGGALAAHLPAYEPRPRQLAMALDAARALEGRAHLLAEAETGIGKTLAYLAPAVLSGMKTVVSTSTKTLQSQLWNKDLPLLRDTLGFDFKAAILKGRKNYLCLWKAAQTGEAALFSSPPPRGLVERLRRWSEETETGHVSEFEGLPENAPLWDDLTVTSDECLGRKCAFYESCFVTRARARAAEADVIVVNHHLYFADLAVRGSAEGFGEVIPGHEAVVFDEAHALERVATQFFGVSLTRGAFTHLAADVRRLAGKKPDGELAAVLEAMVEGAVRYFDSQTAGMASGGRRPLEPHADSPFFAALDSGLLRLRQALKRRAAAGADEAEWAAFLSRAEDLAGRASFLAHADDAAFAYFADTTERGTALRGYPIDVAPLFTERIFGTGRAVLLTSATLRAAGKFDFLRARLGVPEEAGEAFYESPFDHKTQAMLYVPARIPPPTERAAFTAAAVEEARALLKSSRGRAFLLFTSFDMLNAFYEALSGLPFRLLRQGEAPREALLESFREGSSAVLFATSSFWEGVDVQGPALSLVVVDRLPFEVPDDPLLKARLRRVEEAGGHPFLDYQVPQAALALKQAFGRLIRSRRDRGLLALLDIRVASKGYGKAFLKTLPPYPLTRKREEAETFLRSC